MRVVPKLDVPIILAVLSPSTSPCPAGAPLANTFPIGSCVLTGGSHPQAGDTTGQSATTPPR